MFETFSDFETDFESEGFLNCCNEIVRYIVSAEMLLKFVPVCASKHLKNDNFISINFILVDCSFN